MSRLVRILALSAAVVCVAAVTSACGTQKVSVPHAQSRLYHGAVLFSERCAGCHTLSYAATHGSAPNVRTAMDISGPNFDQRCERPVVRVLYAIENGGFSGAYMPQNVVVGQDAIDVARFVATYAGHQAPPAPGAKPCDQRSIGSLPATVGGQPTASIGNGHSAASAGSTGS